MARKKTPKPEPLDPPAEVAERLAFFFHRNGYVRRQSVERKETEDYGSYKKGDEVRLICSSLEELEQIRALLFKARFRPGSPYQKGTGHCQPVYGRKATARFLRIVGG